MDDWDFGSFRDDLKKAVLKLHKGEASRFFILIGIVETYLDCEDKKYKLIIEEI